MSDKWGRLKASSGSLHVESVDDGGAGQVTLGVFGAVRNSEDSDSWEDLLPTTGICCEDEDDGDPTPHESKKKRGANAKATL